MPKTKKRQQLIYIILNNIIKEGFASLTMEDFVKMLPASRATVYRYFSSRDNIISAVVKEYLKYIDSFELPSIVSKDEEWVHSVEKQLEEALILNSHLSAIFWNDLKSEFPDEFSRLQAKINDYHLQLLKFYQAGQKAGIFNLSQPELWILQDHLMIPQIIKPDYLVKHDLTIREAINSYVLMKSQQIIRPAYLANFDSSFVETIIEKMNQEINLSGDD